MIDTSNFLSAVITNEIGLVAYVIASNAVRKNMYLAKNVKYYQCDSIDDNVQINLAQTECSIVVLSDGVFNISATIIGTKSMFALLKDATINMSSSLVNGVQLGGTKTQIGADNPITNTLAGQKLITTIADRTGSISANDFICIADNNLWHNQRSNYTNGEFAQVQSITSTTITTKDNIWLNYTGSVKRLYRYNFVSKIIVGNFVINCGATSVNGVLFRMQVCKDSSVFNVTVDGNAANKSARLGIELSECLDSSASNIIANNIQNAGEALPQGYGVYANNCQNINIFNVSATNGQPCKHLIDTDKSIDYNNSTYCPVSKTIYFKNITAFSQMGNAGNAAPGSTHGGAYDVTIENFSQTIVLADNDTGVFVGVLSRSVKTTLKNITVNAVIINSYCQDIIRIGENSAVVGVDPGDGRSAEDFTAENITMNLIRNVGTFTSTNQGNYFAFKTSAQNVSIKNVTGTGLQGNAILIEGNNNQNVNIDTNTITFNVQLTGKKIVQVSPQSGGLTALNFTFSNNVINNAIDKTSPYVKSVTGLTNYIELNNQVP